MRIYPVKISIGLIKETKDKKEITSWKFSKNTTETIGHYWESLKKKKVVSGVIELKGQKDKIKRLMPAWTADRSFILLNGQWLGLVAIIFLGWLIAFIINFNLKNGIMKFLAKDHVFVSDKIKKKFYRALKWLIISITWLMGVRLLELHLSLLSPLLRLGKIVFVFSSIVVIFNLCDFIAAYFMKKAKASEGTFDDILVPLLQKTSKFLVIAIGFILIGQSAGLDGRVQGRRRCGGDSLPVLGPFPGRGPRRRHQVDAGAVHRSVPCVGPGGRAPQDPQTAP